MSRSSNYLFPFQRNDKAVFGKEYTCTGKEIVLLEFFIVHMNFTELHKCDTLFNLIKSWKAIMPILLNLPLQNPFLIQYANNSLLDHSESLEFKRNHKNTEMITLSVNGISTITRIH